MSDDLQDLFPGQEVKAGGMTIPVVPLFFGQFPQATKLLKPVVAVLKDSNIIRIQQNGANTGIVWADDWLFKLPEIMIEGGEAVIQFLAFAVNMPRDWFDTLPADDGLLLTQAVFTQNANFFVKRILPLMGVIGTNPQVAKTGGEPSPPDSSASAIPGTPSSDTP